MQVSTIAGSQPTFATRNQLSNNVAENEFMVSVQTFDAKNGSGRGTLVRKDDQAPTGDKAVDSAHDGAKTVLDFYKEVLGRNSLDDKGMRIDSVVHYGRNYNNAFWDGSKMTYGDGDGKLFAPLSQGLDVIGHEMTHGVTEHSAGLVYRNQSGALNESWSDVMGELIEQWSENKAGFGTLDAAKAADWLIGEDIMTPGIAGDALRSMKSPGTAYSGDRQPAHMSKYNPTSSDNGGVHINSGIPNKAAYEIGQVIGSEKLAKIWYNAQVKFLKPNSNFADAAAATYAAALQLYGEGPVSSAVADAWKGVGVVAAATPKAITTRVPFDAAAARPDRHESMFPADYRGPAVA